MFDGRDIQERLAEHYLNAAKYVPGDRVVHVPAEGSIEEVGASILKAVDAVLELPRPEQLSGA